MEEEQNVRTNNTQNLNTAALYRCEALLTNNLKEERVLQKTNCS